MKDCGGAVATAGPSVYGGQYPRRKRRVRGRKDDAGGSERGRRGAVKLCTTI